MNSVQPMKFAVPKRQLGITTLLIAILLLAILSIIAVFATSVGVFEQRTETNENRAKLVQATAEASLNLGIEFMRANNALVSAETTNGWLNAASLRWVPCSSGAPSGQPDPCLAERDPTRRAAMYRYTFGGSTQVNVGEIVPTAATLTSVSLGGSATTPVTTTLGAIMCRLDEEDPTSTACVLNPEQPGLVAVTLVSNATIPGESAAAEVKETIATFRTIGGAASVPLVASGTVMGLGNAEIVANPNAGGWGVPASIWSPCPVDIEAGSTGSADPLCPSAGGGVGSVITCHVGEYLKGKPRTSLLTECPFSNNACGCPSISAGSLSGSSQGIRRESIDILDIDGGEGVLPDIKYFPRHPWDDPSDPLDDSMFEVIFQRDVVPQGETSVAQNCGGGSEDCAIVALEAMGATETTCEALSDTSTGLYWARSGQCGKFAPQIGSAEAPVVLVVEGDCETLSIQGNTVVFGMLFIRSSKNCATFAPRGTVKIFGMAVVEGMADPKGNFTLVYSEEIAQAIINSPAFNNFGRLPGSWLDSRVSF